MLTNTSHVEEAQWAEAGANTSTIRRLGVLASDSVFTITTGLADNNMPWVGNNFGNTNITKSVGLSYGRGLQISFEL